MFVPHRNNILVYHATHRMHTTEVYSADTVYSYGKLDLVTHKYAEPIVRVFKAELHKSRAANFVSWRQVFVRHQCVQTL